ncbi:AMP-binding protein [Amycolatopsis thermophila]|uniref:Acyl-CoA synthetase (AMP-forming)/AMP-acid ligase II n=1 Tax=Amycolatopsis thermophila TaxID=206084 RepID=A0ABU0ELF2_9PSEU|nr:AMP-binding protein [Amycolatopsis thermophila]MDQ0376052.1 acyl-CoA synthetase (AMP-forming)/AMP-acid ligase II [Amycolatopsis thermophila]
MSLWGTLPGVLDRACAYYPDRVAIVDGARRLRYRELREWTDRVGNGLHELGVRKGDRVGLLMPNCLEFIPTQHGIWKAGAAMVQMPARASAEDLAFFLEQSGASTLIYHARFDPVVAKFRHRLPGLHRYIRLGEDEAQAETSDYGLVFSAAPAETPVPEPGPHDLAYVAFTSGTTGTPKGVIYTHDAWSHYIVTAGMEIADTRPGEVFAHGAPLTHFTGAFVLPTFIRGGTNVMLPTLDIDLLLDAVAKERVTATAVVPTALYLLLDHPRLAAADLSSLRTVIYAGSPIAPERLRQALAALGPIFVQTYAGHEPGFMTTLRKEDHRSGTPEELARLASAGRPMFHVEMSIQDASDRVLPVGDVGEVCTRQEGQMVGYLNPALDSEAIRGGWVHSGDIGYLDDDGYLYLVDRKKDMIVSGGFNVFPRQVEDVLTQHPAVAHCAVFGVPDPKWGEAVKAVVVPKPGCDVAAGELIDLVKERKGSVWAPKSVDFVSALPLNASGKVDKKSLRAPYWAGQERRIG